MMKVKVGNWTDAKMQDLRPGIKRTIFSRDNITVHMAEVQNGTEAKPHRHEQEQINLVLRGECDFIVEGETYRVKAGGYIIMPPNAEHTIHVYDSPEPVLNVDIWTPRRDEYIDSYEKFLKEST